MHNQQHVINNYAVFIQLYIPSTDQYLDYYLNSKYTCINKKAILYVFRVTLLYLTSPCRRLNITRYFHTATIVSLCAKFLE